jgi:hypothetical protein
VNNLIISQLTAGCERTDCAIADQGQTSTLIAVTPVYDRNGNPIYRDPNTTTAHYRCMTCGKTWAVRSQGRDTVISAA